MEQNNGFYQPNEPSFGSQPPFNPFAYNTAIVKNYFKSKKTLAVALLYGVTALLTIIMSTVFFPKLFNSFIFEMSKYGDIDTESQYFLTSFYSGPTFLLSCIPGLIIVGLIIFAYINIYVKSKNSNPLSIPSAGFTTLFVLSIISLVSVAFMCLYCILAVVILGVASSVVSSQDGAYVFAALMIIMSVIIFLYIGIALFQAISKLRYFLSVKKSITGIELKCGGAMPFGILNIISGIFSIVSGITCFASTFLFDAIINWSNDITGLDFSFGGVMQPTFIFASVVSLVSAATLIVEGILATGYSKYIKSINTGYLNQTQQPPMM